MKKKGLAVLLAAATVLETLAGCGSSEEGGAAQTAGKAQEESSDVVELTMWGAGPAIRSDSWKNSWKGLTTLKDKIKVTYMAPGHNGAGSF